MSNAPRASGDWRHALAAARAAPRCGARSRRSGLACQGAAMPNGRCRMHGGASTGPRPAEGLARCVLAKTKHGRRNAAARALAAQRGQVRAAIAALRRLLAMAEAGDGGIAAEEMLDSGHVER
jgi:hypothetical protein